MDDDLYDEDVDELQIDQKGWKKINDARLKVFSQINWSSMMKILSCDFDHYDLYPILSIMICMIITCRCTCMFHIITWVNAHFMIFYISTL